MRFLDFAATAGGSEDQLGFELDGLYLLLLVYGHALGECETLKEESRCCMTQLLHWLLHNRDGRAQGRGQFKIVKAYECHL